MESIDTDIAIKSRAEAVERPASLLRADLQNRIEQQKSKLVRPVLDQMADLGNTNPELTEVRARILNLQDESSLLQARVVAFHQIQNLQIRQQELAMAGADATRNPADREKMGQEYLGLEEEIQRLRGAKLNGIPVFPEGRELISGPGDPLYRRLKSELSNRESSDEQRFLKKDVAKALFESDVSVQRLAARSEPAERLAEDRLPIYTPTNGGEEQFTVVDREGFINFGKSIAEKERIVYEVNNTFLEPPDPSEFREQYKTDPAERSPAPEPEVVLPVKEKSINNDLVLEQEAQVQALMAQKTASEIVREISEPKEIDVQKQWADRYYEDRYITDRHLAVADYEKFNVNTSHQLLDHIIKDFDESIEEMKESLEALQDNRKDLESINRAYSSEMDITNPDDHVPQISLIGYDNFYGTQVRMISSNVMALLRS